MKQANFHAFVGKAVCVMLRDRRQLSGKLLAFDRHLNLVLCDARESYARDLMKSESAQQSPARRELGLVLVRGDNIVDIGQNVL